MNARKVATIAAVLSLGLLTLAESALAQEERVAQSQGFTCYAIKAKAHDTWPGAGNLSTGVLTHAGALNGTTQYVYDTDAFSTPDSDTFTFGAGWTLTTKYGMVKGRVLFLFNVATGIWTSIATIDPNTSTGKFCRCSRYGLVPQRYDHQSGGRRADLPIRRFRPSLSRNIPSRQRRPQ